MAYGYRPQRPGTIAPNDPRRKRLPLTPEEDPSSGIVPDLGIDFPMSEPLPVPPLTPGIAAPRAPAPAPVEGWQTPPSNLTALRAWYSGAAKVPGAPLAPEWGKETPTYSRLNPPPPKTSAPSAPSQPVLQPGVQRTVSGVPVGPKGFTPTMPTAPMQGFQARPGAMPSLPVQPPMPTADRQRFTLAEAERRAMQQELAGQGAGQYLQEAGMAPFVKQPRGLADLAKEAFIRQAGGAAGLATGGVQRTPGETLRDQYLAIKAGIPQAGATALNFMDVLGRSATAGAPVGQPGATYSPSPATVTPSPVFGYTARGLQQASQDILGQRSPAIQRREQQAEAELAQSQDNALEQVARFALQVYKDPALAEKHILTNLPMMAPGLAAGKVMQTAARVSRLATAEQAAGLGAATAGVLGGAMTASDAQTTAYENIKQALMGRGIPEKDADQEAFRKSLLSFGIGAVLGTAGAMTGAEATAFGGAAQGVRGRLQRAAMEPVTELGEELGPLVTSNIQAGLPAMQNVGQTAGATLLATAPFAGIAAIGRPDGGTNKVPDALQTEAAPAVPPPTGQFGGVMPPSRERQAYENWTKAGGPRVPESYQVLRKSRSLPGQLGLPPVGLPLAGLPESRVPQRPSSPTMEQPAPEPTTETAAPIPPEISFKYGWGAGARPVEALDRVPEQIALRTMRGPEVMAEVQPELEARRAQGEQITARDVRRPKTEAAYIAEAINKTSTRVLKKVAPAYGIETANIDEVVGDVLTNIAREMSEMDNREYTVADIRGAVRLQTGKAAKLAGDERSTLWSRWNEQYGKKMGLSDREYTDLQNLAAGNYGFTFRPDVQAILLGDVGEPYANKRVMEVIRQDMARLMGLPAEDYPSLSLTTVPPNTWRNWALVRKLDVIAPEAYRELMEAVERGPRLKTMTRGERQPSGPTGETPPPPTGPTPPVTPPAPSGAAQPASVTPPRSPRQRLVDADWTIESSQRFTGPDGSTIEREDGSRGRRQGWVHTDAAGNRTNYNTAQEAIEAVLAEPSAKVQPEVKAQPKAERAKTQQEAEPASTQPAAARQRKTKEKLSPESQAAIRRGQIGDKFEAGEVVQTASGRNTTPFPKIAVDTDRKATATIKRVDAWLRDNAIAEAKARGDKFNERGFSSSNPSRLTQGDKDAMEEYLFGEQPVVPPPFLKPLTSSAPVVPTPPEPPVAPEPVTPKPTPPAPPAPAGEAVTPEPTPTGKPTPTETAATGSAETTPAGPRLTKPKPEMPPRGLPLLFEFKRLNSSLITTLEGYRDSLTGPRRAALDELLQLRQQKEDSKKLPRQEASRAFPNKAQQRLRELSKQFEDAEFNIRANAGLARFISAAVPIPARELKATEYRPAITLPKGYVLEGDRYVYKPSAATETEAKPDKAGKVQTAPDDVKQVFATLDSPQGSKARVRKMIKGTYPEIGPKAIFINDNIEQIIAEAEANGKVTKECP